MPHALYMVVEHFKNKDAVAVYRRFRDKGRMAPEGLTYVSSWVDDKIECCFQLMETHDPKLLDLWMADCYSGSMSRSCRRRVCPKFWNRSRAQGVGPRRS